MKNDGRLELGFGILGLIFVGFFYVGIGVGSNGHNAEKTPETIIVGEHDGCTIYVTRAKGLKKDIGWVKCKDQPATAMPYTSQ